MKETAMQELIRQVADEFPFVKELAKGLLEKERQQLIQVWLDCSQTYDMEGFDKEYETLLVEEYLENEFDYAK